MGTILPGVDPSQYGRAEVVTLIGNITRFAFSIAGGIAILFIIWGGVQYLIAFGSQEKAESGKKIMTWAIAGLVVVIISGFIANTIISLIH